jgi:23S rRNA pseudouridine2605 synthase
LKNDRRKIERNVSLARALSKLGYCSRSQAVTIIQGGRVKVNGKIIKSSTHRVSLSDDSISLDGKKIGEKQFVYIMMNKPVGVVTSRSDERGKKTVYDILGDVGKWVFPVGRLDKESAGLLLLTNDNKLGNLLTNPKTKVPKTYEVKLDRLLKEEHRKEMESEMTLNDEKLLPVRVKPMKEKCWYEFTLYEGKNRQIRRMCWTLGYRIEKLIRTRIGNLELLNLKSGEWRYFDAAQISNLKPVT